MCEGAAAVGEGPAAVGEGPAAVDEGAAAVGEGAAAVGEPLDRAEAEGAIGGEVASPRRCIDSRRTFCTCFVRRRKAGMRVRGLIQ